MNDIYFLNTHFFERKNMFTEETRVYLKKKLPVGVCYSSLEEARWCIELNREFENALLKHLGSVMVNKLKDTQKKTSANQWRIWTNSQRSLRVHMGKTGAL